MECLTPPYPFLEVREWHQNFCGQLRFFFKHFSLVKEKQSTKNRIVHSIEFASSLYQNLGFITLCLEILL